MPAFDLIVVGSGGGPDETNLSGYLLKPCDAAWDNGMIALEAGASVRTTVSRDHWLTLSPPGSGLGALRHIMKGDPNIFGERPPDADSTSFTPLTVYSNVKCFLLTHAHLDHIGSLVMAAGTLGGVSKRIYGSPQTLRDLETVFSGRVWPRLATYDENDPLIRLVYNALHSDGKYKVIFPNVSVRIMAISHGTNDCGSYDDSCFFVRHDPSKHEFLFFGDVEPDSIAMKPKNITVWRAAAPKIPHDLSTIFIECSYQAGRPDGELWGHLSPCHLVQELVTLATEVVMARKAPKSRSGLRPRKKQRNDAISPEALHWRTRGERPISHVIGDQCRELLAPHQLGVELLTADQGMKIVAVFVTRFTHGYHPTIDLYLLTHLVP
ncbi:cyclic-AMP phosphodiesterase [Suillus paluster]|uniref:cyclic-AMP phosphodiesterase n=1 Tax=Suillus paluster TaxID=48578 RepID=UPI001B860287|nr:cyclic-AMP phosphodiesterase [Suillus paluster]KAG1749119.1 cyclic-AMP phosphodiesterase [Suillus paluster]